MVWVLPLRSRQPALLDCGGGPQNSRRSDNCGPDPASICAARPSPTGGRENQIPEKKSGVQEARSASCTGIPTNGHVCTREQRTRPHEAPFSRPAGRGKGGGLGVGSSVLLPLAEPPVLLASACWRGCEVPPVIPDLIRDPYSMFHCDARAVDCGSGPQ